jgi:hypothetical protein
MTPTSVLAIDASAGRLATVEALRRESKQGSLTVLDAELRLPYDRPPLSKQDLSGLWESDRAHLRQESQLSGLDAEFVFGDPAVGPDPAERNCGRRCGAAATCPAVPAGRSSHWRTRLEHAQAGPHVAPGSRRRPRRHRTCFVSRGRAKTAPPGSRERKIRP